MDDAPISPHLTSQYQMNNLALYLFPQLQWDLLPCLLL